MSNTLQYVDRLTKLLQDVANYPVTDLVLSEGRVYGARYYTVQPVGGNWLDMETWCHEIFGTTSSIWEETKNLTPKPLQRWYMNNSKFWFREEADREWFVMRWR